VSYFKLFIGTVVSARTNLDHGEIMPHEITLIYGDGIGPEVVRAAVDIIEAAHVKVNWHEKWLGIDGLKHSNAVVPKDTIESIKATKVALKGPTTTPIGFGHRSGNVILRKELDLYACIRPVKSIPGIKTCFSDVDLVVIRENTEGLYSGPEFEIQPGCVITLRTMTEKACTRIAQAAFKYAEKCNRHKVWVAHKANILKMGDGLLLAAAQKVRKDYPDIDYEEIIIDALAMRLVTHPTDFDVIFLENMFGDIISDLCAGLIGGLGLVPGTNIGEEWAVFEAVHGSAPDIAGSDLANPCALIQSSLMMLRHLGENHAAHKIESALFSVLSEKPLRTRDLGGKSGTKQFTKNVIARL
jgi:isocitrate dehydrogenase (NAD+)